MAVVDGSVWALSARGYVARDGVCVAQLEPGDFEFTTMFGGTKRAVSMRSDGAVYVDTVAQPVFRFEGGPGLDDAEEGEAEDTTWRAGAVGPEGMIWGLRRDGKVIAGVPVVGETGNGILVSNLPFGNQATDALLYETIFFTEAGNWTVMRGRGEMFNMDNQLTAFIEFNGTPNNGSNQRYMETLALPASVDGTTDMSFFALRRDGKLYRETDVAAQFEFSKSGYGQLALSDVGPDLTNIKNAKPVVTVYQAHVVTGDAYSFPILATDVDLDSSELVVTVDPETLPENTTYDPETRTINCTSAVKGKAKIKVEVDDGIAKPVKKTMSVQTRDPDDNEAKNKKPRISAVKGTQALVNFELRIPLIVSDEDGDELTVTVDETQPPFTFGAMFDAETNTFIWPDPELTHLGNYKVKFTVSDGIANASTTVKFEVISSFLTF